MKKRHFRPKQALCVGLLLVLITGSFSCDQSQDPIHPSVISVVFNGQDIIFEQFESQWDSTSGNLHIQAKGYNYEQFGLSMKVSQKGSFEAAISQIYFSDGLSFRPHKLTSGKLVIGQVTAQKVEGTFNVNFESDFLFPDVGTIHNGQIIGGFSINR